MRISTISALRLAAISAAILAIVAAMAPARATEPTFPLGSRIGLVPPSGMTVSHNFMGFEDRFRNAAILLATFPADAFEQLQKSMVPDALKKQNLDIETREPIDTASGHGFLLIGKQTINNAPYRKFMLVAPAGNITALVSVQIPEQDPTYTDSAVRDALATVAVREVPDAENLGLLPFRIADMADFRIDDILPGRAIMLVDGAAGETAGKPDATGKAVANAADQITAKADGQVGASVNSDRSGHPINARLLIAAVTGGPNDLKNAGEFARNTFAQIGGIKKVRIQDAEMLRIGGQPGFEMLANAQDPQTGGDLRVVQWLRFGSGVYLQMVGIARADVWLDEFARMRKVRDAIEAK